jgi:cation diffusion facilitator CzcD-associated flavoprotein CzcO
LKIDTQGLYVECQSYQVIDVISCACDVPSHNYTWSFEPKLDWSAVYASSREIYQYFTDFATKYRLHNYIQTSHQVIGATWDNETGRWNVKIKNLQTKEEFQNSCDILINAGGILNNWRWPAIPGLSEYKGTLLHTANWDDGVQLEGKHVGLIGNGLVEFLSLCMENVNALQLFWYTGSSNYSAKSQKMHDLHS